MMSRAEITARGMVQGVGFRFYVHRHANELGLLGYTSNLPSGDEVYTVVEGEKDKIIELFELISLGPSYSEVEDCQIKWTDFLDEFKTFEIRHW